MLYTISVLAYNGIKKLEKSVEMEFLKETISVWERLAAEHRPIVLYGMGDGADKILHVFATKEIQVRAVFASDEFVRGHSFAGFRVCKLSDVIEQYGQNIVIVLAFASQRPELLARFDTLNQQFDLVAPDVPVAGDGLFDLDFVRTYADRLKRAYEWMADEQSRHVFANVVNFKISGRIDYLRDCATDKKEVFETILKPQSDDHFCDLGAYNGDTIREWLSYTDNQYASITAMEPDRRNFRKLTQYTEQELNHERVQLIQAGGWSQDTMLSFAAKAGRNSSLCGQGTLTEMRALDSVLNGAPCTAIKMDVEGAEHAALMGAQHTIAMQRPRMNIACYHRNIDLFDLPETIRSIAPDYRLYLRHHPYVPAWDVNLYAISDKIGQITRNVYG